MTAMKSAMKQAGVNTDAAELYSMAVKALQIHKGDVQKALLRFVAEVRRRPSLLDALALDYLQRVAADMGTTKSDGAAEATKVTAAPIAKPKPRPYQRPSAEEKAAALKSKMLVANAIFEYRIDGKAIGDIRYFELDDLMRTHARRAGSILNLGAEQTERALWLAKIRNFGQPTNNTMKIREFMTADIMQRTREEARKETPLIIERGARAYAEQLERSAGNSGTALEHP